MRERQVVMGNHFCHMELTSYNVDGAKEFYAKVFDWKLNEFPNASMPYTMIDTGKEVGGGITGLPMPGVPTAWTVYIETDDVDAACAKVTEAGGKVWHGPDDVPGVGRYAVACDPQGAYFGLWKSFEQK